MSLTRGAKLGPYEIVAPLGAGGMGEVYRARDTRLDRDVAIKVLPPQLSANAEHRGRFEREAKAVAALSHPNILAIYDVGHQDDIAYVVTELLDGETLRQTLQEGAIGRRRALEIGIAIADGLAAAHARGIVHRDLKPENIFITTDGVVKILDFGLARVEEAGQPAQQHTPHTPTITLYTTPGTVLGTLNYMSPEQIRALRTDARSDVFSFGCVLYEMLTGERAFQGETSADTMTAILREAPKSVRTKRHDIGPDVERIIERCLEKKAEARFQSSQDLAFTLRSVLADSGLTKTLGPPRSARRSRSAGGVVVAAILIATVFMVIRYGLNRNKAEARPKIASLAVLPLENVSRDSEQDYFVDGMTEALISDLAKVGGLKVISRTSAMRYKATTKSLPEIARELNVDAIVEGSVQRAGERVRITAQLIHAATDEHLWSETYDRDLGDILRLQSEVARTIAQEIKGTLTPQEQARIGGDQAVKPEAYQAYLKGRFHWNKRTPDGLQRAVEYFEQAIALAPDWPLGYAGLADAYLLMPWYSTMPPSEANPKARMAAAKALEMDESLAEAHATMAVIAADYDRDWPTAQREFQRALALSPNYATAHQWYGLQLRFRGRHDEAIKEASKALELDPLSLIISVNVGEMYYDVGDLERAETQFRKTLEFAPDFVEAHIWLVHTLILQGRSAEATTQAREAVRLSNNDSRCASTLGYVYAKSGQTQEARRILDEITARSKEAYVAPTHLALLHAGLEDRDQMFEWLDKAYQEHDVRLLDTLIDPLLADMRSDPRFVDLVRRLGLPPLAPLPSTTAQPSSLPRGDKGALPRSGKVMLAVLPFENLSRDPEQEFFSDGLTEEMIAQLGQLNPKKLGVIARTSAMHYKNTVKTIDAIGRELGVAYVVEGSVRRAGERVRITAQLIQVSDQTHLWAENYERDLNDILALQSDVAQRIAESLSVELLSAPAASARVRTISPAAHEAYLKGRFHWNKRTPDGLQRAVEYFEQTVSLAPDWPLGYVGLADAYLVMPYWAPVRPSEAIPKARAAGTKALALDESLGEAHATMAVIAADYDWNWPTAEREYERALALSPNYATAHQWYAESLMHVNRHDQAINEMIKAQELDPLSLMIGVNLGLAYYYAGDFEQAEIHLRKTLEIDPDFPQAHGALAKTSALRGRFGQAVAEAREAVRLSHNAPMFAALLGYAHARAGQAQEARKVIDELGARSIGAYVAPIHFVHIHAGLDEKDRVFEWLERAYRERDLWLPYTLPDPLLAPMRADPRFADLARRVGLTHLSSPSAASSTTPSTEGKTTLAVLPFVNDSGDDELDYLSDGIAETLINGFSRIEAMNTVPRSSAFRHKRDDADPVDIGRRLSATAILTGRVLKRGEHLTIQAELVDVAKGRQLWGERYQRKAADLVEIEREIAGEITKALSVRLSGEEKQELSRGYSENSEAYRLYLQGRFWWAKRTKEGFDQALRLLKQAIQTDPKFALAHSGLADCYSLLPLYGLMTPKEAQASARASAETALRLDDQLAEAHTSMGMVHFYLEWDFAAADKEFERALELNPRYATTYQWSGLCVGVRGRLDEARAKLRKAVELDPLMPIFTHNLSWLYMWQHHWQEALDAAQAGLEFAPEFPWLQQAVGLSLLELGRPDEALEHLRRGVEIAGDASFANSYLAYGLGRAGHKEECQAIIDQWLELSTWRYLPPCDMAIMYMGLGDKEQALRWLEKGFEQRDVWMSFISVLPFWDPLRDDPRFLSLLRRLALPDLRATTDSIRSGGASQ